QGAAFLVSDDERRELGAQELFEVRVLVEDRLVAHALATAQDRAAAGLQAAGVDGVDDAVDGAFGGGYLDEAPERRRNGELAGLGDELGDGGVDDLADGGIDGGAYGEAVGAVQGLHLLPPKMSTPGTVV